MDNIHNHDLGYLRFASSGTNLSGFQDFDDGVDVIGDGEYIRFQQIVIQQMPGVMAGAINGFSLNLITLSHSQYIYQYDYSMDHTVD